MAIADNERITLLINGQSHDYWTRYEVDSDLFIPADAWSLSLAVPLNGVPPKLSAGASIQLKLGRDTVLMGELDTVRHSINNQSHDLSLQGRDGAGKLVDCSAPIFVAKQATLGEVVAQIVKPLGFSKIKISAQKARVFDKINIEPGDTAWDALQHAAEAAGLWPWFASDGTLMVGGPDYNQATVGTLTLGPDGNIQSLSETRNIARRMSELTVLGQAHGTGDQTGKHALKAVVKDASVKGYRPKIVVDCEADTPAAAMAKARKLLADSRLEGYTVEVIVRGHRAPNGQPWEPGQRVEVISEVHGIKQVLFICARRFTGGRQVATTTTLTCKEDGVWILDAHPHKKKHRRGKNTSAGEVLPIEAGHD